MQSRIRIALYATAILVIFIVLLQQRQPVRDKLIDELIRASIQTGTPFPIPDRQLLINNDFAGAYRQLYRDRPTHDLSITLQYLEPLQQCPRSPNKSTGHIRLPHIIHHNISLHTSDHPFDAEARHFNPTTIPLPAYAASFTSARYILVSRLVTPGLHQESLACLAAFCLPGPTSNHTSTRSNSTSSESQSERSQHLPPDAVPCTADDLATLGASGGLRCITPPRRLNIPPTPAKQCNGEWASFPDIPGFHDPRIMWSNLGEPLIVVNSASTYGCVGLWVMDLRMLLPELQAVMERRPPTESGSSGNGKIGRRGEGQETIQEAGKVKYSQPVVGYRKLTELTRWEGRAEVEKNWMLWFPGQDGEVWLSYELFGKWEQNGQGGGQVHDNPDETEKAAQGPHPPTPQDRELLLPPWPVLNFSNVTLQAGAGNSSDSEAHADLSTPLASLLNSTVDNSTHGSFSSSSNTLDTINTTTTFPLHPSSQPSSSTTATNVNSTSSFLLHQPAKRGLKSTSPLSPASPAPTSSTSTPASRSNHSPSPSHFHQSHAFSRGRHIVHLLSHGFATPNLTFPAEQPCLFPSDAPDSLGREGHWHQSTPALRLRLCYRSGRAGGGPSVAGGGSEERDGKVCSGGKVEDGEEVFFTVVHRKFSDEALGMPLRYERFVVVWEGRWPWRVLGVGKGAVVFGGEVVRGFEDVDVQEEDGGGKREGGEEGEEDQVVKRERDRGFMKRVGFTYTTSIAWAWRPVGDEGLEEGDGGENEYVEHLSRLGAGYLGDEIIMGIGLDDVAQVVVRVKVEELLVCLRLCPGINEVQTTMS